MALPIAVASIGTTAVGSEQPSERAQLAQLLRQLDLLDHSAQQSASVRSADEDRYYFDYARLHTDIAKIRAGVKDYLAPRRAQPRDPASLSGDYRRERTTLQ